MPVRPSELWNLGGVAGLEIVGAPFFIQGGFRDPFGHNWSVGDISPLARHRS